MPPSKRRKGKQANNSSSNNNNTTAPPPRHTSTRQTTAAAVAAAQAAADAGRPFDADSDVLRMAQLNSKESTTTMPNKASGGWITDENDLVLTSSAKRRGAYECDYCHGDISQVPRIRCAVCDDFDLCLDCFAANLLGDGSASGNAATSTSGSHALPHNPSTHGYRVCDSTRYPIFPTSKQWSTKAFASAVTAPPSPQREGGGGGATTPPPPGAASASAISAPAESDKMEIENEKDTTAKGEEETAPSAATGSALATPKVSAAAAAAAAAATTTTATTASSSSYTFRADDPRVYWTVEEDLRLLEGIANHGLGNWVEIAETVQGQGSVNKTAKRCMERYLDDYLGRYGQILPPYTLIPYEEDNDNDGGGASTTAVAATEAAAAATSNPNQTDVAAMSSSADSLAGDSSVAASSVAAPSRSSTPGPPSQTAAAAMDSAASAASSSVVQQEPFSQELPSRSSKRRAALFRSPSSVSTSGGLGGGGGGGSHAATLASRKKYKIVRTESLEGFREQFWPHPYFPSDSNPHILKGGEVGRDQITKAEQAFVKATSSVQSEAEVKAIHQEWKETRLFKPNGPTCLPPRPEDVMAMSGAELAGFMPRRGDFDIEWENDAEEAIGDMEFLPGDSEEDTKLKLKVLAIYNAKLDKREKLKKFIISRKLWDYRKLHHDYESLPRDERDLAHRMRIFERFHTPEEHALFLNDILKAKRLRKEIAKLQMYRRLGIRTLVEAEQYELDKARRQFHKTAHTAAQKKVLEAQRKSGISAGGSDDGSRGQDDLNASASTASSSSSLWKKYRTNDRRARKSANRENSMESGSAAATPSEKKTDEANNSSSMMDVDAAPAVNLAPSTTTTTPQPTTVATSQEPASASGADGDKKPAAKKETPQQPSPTLFLSSQEVDLCQKVGLTHEQYREIKKVLVQESLMAGMLDKEGAGSSRRALIKMDVERRGQVLDFFLRAGWVSTRLSHIARSLPHSQAQS